MVAANTSSSMSMRIAVRWSLIAITVVGLFIDACVHFDLAAQYDAIASTTLSQGDLFRAEAVASILIGVGLTARPRRYTAGLAALVAGAGAIALIAYRHYDIRASGPIPAMYEPVWFTEKTTAAVAEVVATLTAIGTVFVIGRPAPAPDDGVGDAPNQPSRTSPR